MSKRRSIFLVAGVVIVAVLVSAQVLRAQPPVSWSPLTFDVAVPPGGLLPTSLTLTITRNIPSSRVEVTPSIAPYITSIEPATLPALSAGSKVAINLVFQVPTSTPHRIVRGTLRLRETSGRGTGTQASPLPVMLTIGNLLYPPDPGEAGKETLEGIDSDGDGVRDDIQRYIELTYPDEPIVREGLRQYAHPLQLALRDAQSEQQAVDHRSVLEKARECIRSQVDYEKGRLAMRSLIGEMLNTRDRSVAYLTWNRQLGGKTFPFPSVDSPSACDFDVISLGGAR